MEEGSVPEVVLDGHSPLSASSQINDDSSASPMSFGDDVVSPLGSPGRLLGLQSGSAPGSRFSSSPPASAPATMPKPHTIEDVLVEIDELFCALLRCELLLLKALGVLSERRVQIKRVLETLETDSQASPQTQRLLEYCAGLAANQQGMRDTAQIQWVMETLRTRLVTLFFSEIGAIRAVPEILFVSLSRAWKMLGVCLRLVPSSEVGVVGVHRLKHLNALKYSQYVHRSCAVRHPERTAEAAFSTAQYFATLLGTIYLQSPAVLILHEGVFYKRNETHLLFMALAVEHGCLANLIIERKELEEEIQCYVNTTSNMLEKFAEILDVFKPDSGVLLNSETSLTATSTSRPLSDDDDDDEEEEEEDPTASLQDQSRRLHLAATKLFPPPHCTTPRSTSSAHDLNYIVHHEYRRSSWARQRGKGGKGRSTFDTSPRHHALEICFLPGRQLVSARFPFSDVLLKMLREGGLKGEEEEGDGLVAASHHRLARLFCSVLAASSVGATIRLSLLFILLFCRQRYHRLLFAPFSQLRAFFNGEEEVAETTYSWGRHIKPPVVSFAFLPVVAAVFYARRDSTNEEDIYTNVDNLPIPPPISWPQHECYVRNRKILVEEQWRGVAPEILAELKVEYEMVGELANGHLKQILSGAVQRPFLHGLVLSVYVKKRGGGVVDVLSQHLLFYLEHIVTQHWGFVERQRVAASPTGSPKSPPHSPGSPLRGEEISSGQKGVAAAGAELAALLAEACATFKFCASHSVGGIEFTEEILHAFSLEIRLLQPCAGVISLGIFNEDLALKYEENAERIIEATMEVLFAAIQLAFEEKEPEANPFRPQPLQESAEEMQSRITDAIELLLNLPLWGAMFDAAIERGEPEVLLLPFRAFERRFGSVSQYDGYFMSYLTSVLSMSPLFDHKRVAHHFTLSGEGNAIQIVQQNLTLCRILAFGFSTLRFSSCDAALGGDSSLFAATLATGVILGDDSIPTPVLSRDTPLCSGLAGLFQFCFVLAKSGADNSVLEAAASAQSFEGLTVRWGDEVASLVSNGRINASGEPFAPKNVAELLGFYILREAKMIRYSVQLLSRYLFDRIKVLDLLDSVAHNAYVGRGVDLLKEHSNISVVDQLDALAVHVADSFSAVSCFIDDETVFSHLASGYLYLGAFLALARYDPSSERSILFCLSCLLLLVNSDPVEGVLMWLHFWHLTKSRAVENPAVRETLAAVMGDIRFVSTLSEIRMIFERLTICENVIEEGGRVGCATVDALETQNQHIRALFKKGLLVSSDTDNISTDNTTDVSEADNVTDAAQLLTALSVLAVPPHQGAPLIPSPSTARDVAANKVRLHNVSNPCVFPDDFGVEFSDMVLFRTPCFDPNPSIIDEIVTQQGLRIARLNEYSSAGRSGCLGDLFISQLRSAMHRGTALLEGFLGNEVSILQKYLRAFDLNPIVLNKGVIEEVGGILYSDPNLPEQIARLRFDPEKAEMLWKSQREVAALCETFVMCVDSAAEATRPILCLQLLEFLASDDTLQHSASHHRLAWTQLLGVLFNLFSESLRSTEDSPLRPYFDHDSEVLHYCKRVVALSHKICRHLSVSERGKLRDMYIILKGLKDSTVEETISEQELAGATDFSVSEGQVVEACMDYNHFAGRRWRTPGLLRVTTKLLETPLSHTLAAVFHRFRLKSVDSSACLLVLCKAIHDAEEQVSENKEGEGEGEEISLFAQNLRTLSNRSVKTLLMAIFSNEFLRDFEEGLACTADEDSGDDFAQKISTIAGNIEGCITHMIAVTNMPHSELDMSDVCSEFIRVFSRFNPMKSLQIVLQNMPQLGSFISSVSPLNCCVADALLAEPLPFLSWMQAAYDQMTSTPRHSASVTQCWVTCAQLVYSYVSTEVVSADEIAVWEVVSDFFTHLCRVLVEAGFRGRSSCPLLAVSQSLVLLSLAAEVTMVNKMPGLLFFCSTDTTRYPPLCFPAQLRENICNSLPWYQATFHRDGPSLWVFFRTLKEMKMQDEERRAPTLLEFIDCLCLLDWQFLPTADEATKRGLADSLLHILCYVALIDLDKVKKILSKITDPIPDAKKPCPLWHGLWSYTDPTVFSRISMSAILRENLTGEKAIAGLLEMLTLITQIFLLYATEDFNAQHGSLVVRSTVESNAAAFAADVRQLMFCVIQSPEHCQAWIFSFSTHIHLFNSILRKLTEAYGTNDNARYFISTVVSCISATLTPADMIKTVTVCKGRLPYASQCSSLAVAMRKVTEVAEHEHAGVLKELRTSLISIVCGTVSSQMCLAVLSSVTMLLPVSMMLVDLMEAGFKSLRQLERRGDGDTVGTPMSPNSASSKCNLLLTQISSSLLLPPSDADCTYLINLCRQTNHLTLLLVCFCCVLNVMEFFPHIAGVVAE